MYKNIILRLELSFLYVSRVETLINNFYKRSKNNNKKIKPTALLYILNNFIRKYFRA